MKSLYGLIKASRYWNIKFIGFLIRLSFVRSKKVYGLYTILKKDDDHLEIIVYVNDLLIACKRLSKIMEFKQKLKEQFETADCGEF